MKDTSYKQDYNDINKLRTILEVNKGKCEFC